MLVAYFDESGTHGNQSRVTTIAGLVGDSIEWSRLESPWKKRLGAIACFHATDCAATKLDFKHLSKPEAAGLMEDMAALISDRNLVAIGASVYHDDWNYGASVKLKAQFRSPYHFCVSLAIMQACKVSNDYAGGDPVAFVFAEQNQYDEYSRTIHDVFRSNDDFPNAGHFGFGKPKCVLPLQAADLYAYETYRELLYQLDTPNMHAPERSPMKIMLRKLTSRSVIADIAYLHSVGDGLDSLRAGRKPGDSGQDG